MPSPAIKIDPQVVFRRLDDRMVLVHLGSNQIFELNETSARLVELLSADGDVRRATARLIEEFDADPAQITEAVDRTLGVMLSERLVAHVGGA